MRDLKVADITYAHTTVNSSAATLSKMATFLKHTVYCAEAGMASGEDKSFLRFLTIYLLGTLTLAPMVSVFCHISTVRIFQKPICACEGVTSCVQKQPSEAGLSLSESQFWIRSL